MMSAGNRSEMTCDGRGSGSLRLSRTHQAVRTWRDWRVSIRVAAWENPSPAQVLTALTTSAPTAFLKLIFFPERQSRQGCFYFILFFLNRTSIISTVIVNRATNY